jgi:uncharacterized protein
MFGPYEITCDGRTCYGNVALKEHHIVEREGEYALFRVRDMAALPISRALTGAIARMMPTPGTLIPDGFMQALREVGLVAEGEETEAVPPAGEGAASRPPPGPRVVNMALFVTQTCNMRCVYCYGNGGEYGERGVMTRETAFEAVDWLMESSMDAKTVHVGFFGGEPLMDFPLIRQVVAYAKEQAARRGKEVDFNMTTNGSLLTEEIISFMDEEKIDPLISFDGPPGIQDRQRPFRNGKGSYNRVVANVQRLRAVMPNLSARATLCGDSDPFVIRRAMEAAGFVNCHVTPASPVILGQTGNGAVPARAARTGERTAEKMMAYERAATARLFAAVKNRSLDPASPPEGLHLLAALAEGKRRHAACGIGRGLQAVAVNGDVYPCQRFVGLTDVRLGHVRDYRVNGLNDYHRAVVENLPVCRTCWARYLCGGGCFYDNMAHTGDMHRPNPSHCVGMKAMAVDLIHGWCGLTEDDKAYVREQSKDLDPDLRP